jgi:alkyl hydroperoxide reductase subunit D
MSIEALKIALPSYAKDLKLNLGTVFTSTGLNAQQIWGAALSAAIAARNSTVITHISAEAIKILTPEATEAAKAAAAIMGMNNIYYRFIHLVGGDYSQMPARLRMNVIANPGVDKLDFELWCLGVSAVNGCGMCMESHEHEVIKNGATRDMVQDIIRIAAVIHGIAQILEAEDYLAA